MTRSTYVKPGTIRGLGLVVGLIGLVAALAGPTYAISGAFQAGAAVVVPVELIEPPVTDAARTSASLPALPDGVRIAGLTPGSELELSAPGSTVLEQLLSRGDAAVLGLAVGLGAWLLRPLLASVAAGRPFGAGNARRLAGLASVVVVAAGIGPLLPQIASLAVLDRLDLVGPDSPFVMGLTFAFTPAVLTGLLLLVLAEAFRQGERLSADVEGLV